MMKIPTGVKKAVSVADMFADTPLYDRFAAAKAAGFTHVELGDWINLDLTRVATELEQNNLHLAAMIGSCRHSIADPEQRENFLEHLSQSIAVAKSFTCHNLLLLSPEDAKSMPLDRSNRGDFTKIAASTRALVDAAAMACRAGITLHLKPLSAAAFPNALSNIIRSVGEIVRVVDSRNLSLLVPLGFAGERENDVFDTMRAYREHIRHIHIGNPCRSDQPRTRLTTAFVRRILGEALAFNGVACLVSQENGLPLDAWREL